MEKSSRIYLDNAATSWPKPESVYVEIEEYLRNNGSALGRTTGTFADEIVGEISRLREDVKKLIHSKTASVLFAFNGTDALNLAIQGTVSQGDHVVTTMAEHNSVLRPLKALEKKNKVQVTRIPCDSKGRVTAEEVLQQVNSRTRLVAITHCSNVTGAENPICEIGRQLQGSESLFLVDAAQTLGSAAVQFDQFGVDLLASPGHKGLLGPLGTGILAVSSKAQASLHPIRQGGTGASSESDDHPQNFPEAYEAGNHNVPGLIGLKAGLKFVAEVGVEAIAKHKLELARNLQSKISELKNVEVVGDESTCKSGIVSFNLSLPPNEVATILDSTFGIQCRAGYHCASLIHPYIGTENGCVRISFGYFNTREQSDLVADAITEISKAI